jgi:hypothetical protein
VRHLVVRRLEAPEGLQVAHVERRPRRQVLVCLVVFGGSVC